MPQPTERFSNIPQTIMLCWDLPNKTIDIENTIKSSMEMQSGIHFAFYHNYFEKVIICYSERNRKEQELIQDIKDMTQSKYIELDFNSPYMPKDMADFCFQDGSDNPYAMGIDKKACMNQYGAEMTKKSFQGKKEVMAEIYVGTKIIATKKLIIMD